MKHAKMCDLLAGYPDASSGKLVLEIYVPTATREEHKKVKDAIQKAIEEMGFGVEWIPSM